MELRRSRFALVVGILILAFGMFELLHDRADDAFPSVGAMIWGGVALLTGSGIVVHELRPFRLHIGPDGVTVRLPGLDRLVPWAEIDAIILDHPVPDMVHRRAPSPSLLLVPASGSALDRPLTRRSPVDDRPCLELLDLGRVTRSPTEVARALARYGGSRFTDTRRLTRQRFNRPDFTVALRGYDPDRVNDLIRRGRQALTSDVVWERYAAKAEIDKARTNLPIGLRGYDREHVDAFLEDLSAALASFGGDERAAD